MPQLVLPKATSRGGSLQPGCSVGPVLGVNVLLGSPAYLFAFFFTYAFRDSIGWSAHLTFVATIAAYSVVTGILALSPAASRYRESSLHILTFGVLSSLALNAAAVGIGSIVSDANKNQGSVTAGFSTTADIVVGLACFGLAGAFAFTANSVRRSL